MTKISIVVDNQAGEGLVAEHGLSLWIETAGRHILFDTGQGSAIGKNAQIMGIDLGVTDFIVLSHGHYDHTGGVPQGLRRANKATLYCHPGSIYPRYSVCGGTAKSLQMPHVTMAAIDKLPWEQIRWVQSPLMLADTVGLTGSIPRHTPFEDTGGTFFLDPKGMRPDPMADELALWIKTDQGVIVCVGCAHAGIVNTLNHVQGLIGGMRIRAVIGGFHLLHADKSRLEQTIAALRSLSLDLLLPCHCTGARVVAEFGRVFGEKCRPGAAGMTYIF